MPDALQEFARELSYFESVRLSDSPVRFDAASGMYSVFSYTDVVGVLRNSDEFSNTPPGAAYESRNAMLFTDPPHHRDLRTLVSKAFTPASIAKLEGRLREIIGELMEGIGDSPTFDVVSRIAAPLPEIMIAEMLGVDPESRSKFKDWSRSFSMVVTSQANVTTGLDQHTKVLEEMFDHFDPIIAERRIRPRDDLITRLVQAEAEGNRLTMEELRATCAQLLAAGNETTTNLIGNAVICLTQRPDLLIQARTEPELVPGIIEEVLRYLGPAQFVPRYVKKTATLQGHTLEPGTPVLAMLASANRDKDAFDDPDEFDPRRRPNRHLGLGSGIHFCLGSALARLEAKVALEHMITHLDGEWSIGEELERLPDVPFFFGVTSLPLTVSPGRTR